MDRKAGGESVRDDWDAEEIEDWEAEVVGSSSSVNEKGFQSSIAVKGFVGEKGRLDTEENVSLGKQQKSLPASKMKLKQKLKHPTSYVDGREDKVVELRNLMCGPGQKDVEPRKDFTGSKEEWLDPHCDESLFERRNLRKQSNPADDFFM